MDKTKVKPKQKSEQQKANDFIKEYKALCEEHGFQIVVTPAYRVSQDTGTWHTVLQTSVGKLPKRVE